jgi:Cu2+-exporting ATPase
VTGPNCWKDGDGVDSQKDRATAVLDVSGLLWASEQNVIAARLGRRPGVLHLEVNPVAQAATVVFDPGRTSVAELRRWVLECGYHCAGQSVPSHVCDPLGEPDPPAAQAVRMERAAPIETGAGTSPAAPAPAVQPPEHPTGMHAGVGDRGGVTNPTRHNRSIVCKSVAMIGCSEVVPILCRHGRHPALG